MDERTRTQIEWYLPHDPDPALDAEEYYYLQWTAGATGEPRVIRVFALDIFPRKNSVEYGIYQRRGNQLFRIDAGYGDSFRGVTMGDLYDNKQDCKDQTHGGVYWWPELREAQRKERERHAQTKNAH